MWNDFVTVLRSPSGGHSCVTCRPSDLRHSFRPDFTLLRGDAEGSIGRAVACIAVLALDDFEEEAFTVVAAVELKILPLVVAVIKDVFGFQPCDEIASGSETRFQIIIVIRRDFQGLEATRPQSAGRGEDIVAGESEMLHARAKALGNEMAGQRPAVLGPVQRQPEAAGR